MIRTCMILHSVLAWLAAVCPTTQQIMEAIAHQFAGWWSVAWSFSTPNLILSWTHLHLHPHFRLRCRELSFSMGMCLASRICGHACYGMGHGYHDQIAKGNRVSVSTMRCPGMLSSDQADELGADPVARPHTETPLYQHTYTVFFRQVERQGVIQFAVGFLPCAYVDLEMNSPSSRLLHSRY